MFSTCDMGGECRGGVRTGQLWKAGFAKAVRLRLNREAAPAIQCGNLMHSLARLACLSGWLLTLTVARAEDAPPLPELDLVLERMVERAQLEEPNDHDFKQRYQFRTIRLREEFNAKGRVTKRKERNRLNEPDLEAEPILYLRATKAEAGASLKLDERAAAEQLTSGKAFSRDDFPVDTKTLKRFDFTLQGRETLGDRTVLVLDFVPAKKQPSPSGLKERLINRAAGRIWVDEQDWAVAKADLHLSEPVSVLGGVIGVLRSFKYQFHRERTLEGLWYPARVDWRLEGRQLFSNKVVVSEERKEEVRKVR